MLKHNSMMDKAHPVGWYHPTGLIYIILNKNLMFVVVAIVPPVLPVQPVIPALKFNGRHHFSFYPVRNSFPL